MIMKDKYEMPRIKPGMKRLTGVLYNPNGKVSAEAKMRMRRKCWGMGASSQLLSFTDGTEGEVVLCWEMHESLESGIYYRIRNKLRKLLTAALCKIDLDDLFVTVEIEVDAGLAAMDGTDDL